MDISDGELLNASQQYEAETERFANVKLKTDEDIQNLAKESVCNSTKKKAMWAVRIFESWRKNCNIHVRKHPKLNLSEIHPTLLEMTNDELNFAIAGLFPRSRRLMATTTLKSPCMKWYVAYKSS